LQKVFRINIISPGIEFELPISEKSTIAANTGIGMHGSYLNLDYTSTGITYYISPFLDLSYKTIYNQQKRASKGKNINYNTGNYWGLRLLTNFHYCPVKIGSLIYNKLVINTLQRLNF